MMIDPRTIKPAYAVASQMLEQTAALARKPAATVAMLYTSLEWYAARPRTAVTPLVVQVWISQTVKLIHQYQDVLSRLVELQVETIDHHTQASAHPTPEETDRVTTFPQIDADTCPDGPRTDGLRRPHLQGDAVLGQFREPCLHRVHQAQPDRPFTCAHRDQTSGEPPLGNPTYRISAAQIAAAQAAQEMIEAICQADPDAIPPISARQMVINEGLGWVWDFASGQYQRENK